MKQCHLVSVYVTIVSLWSIISLHQTLVSGPPFPLPELLESSSVLIETEVLWSPLVGTAICLLMEEGRPAPSSVHSNMVRPKMRNMR